MANYLFCDKCKKTLAEVNFYTYKDGSKCELCKACLTMHINNFDDSTYLWLLEKFDVPYMPWEWDIIRDRAYQKDPYKMTGMSVFGKYLSKMKLKQFRYDKETGEEVHWADTERIQERHKLEEETLSKFNEEQRKENLENMKSALEHGDITQAQYDTYAAVVDAKLQPVNIDYSALPKEQRPPGMADAAFYPVNDHPFEQVDLPDPGEQLTAEDKIYLATRWGRFYTGADWVYLEQKYKEYENSFDLHNADLVAGTIQICKLDLKMNQALDTGDIDSYSKLSRSADSLRKSLKFTEAQRKDDKTSEISCYGQMVSFVEMHNDEDFISPIDLSIDRDIVDTDIHDMKNFTQNLVYEDPAIFKLIEEYIKKREILAEQEADAKNEDFELTDADFKEYSDFVNEINNEEEDE